MKQFKFFLLFILNFEISFLYFGPIIRREFQGEDIESTHFSKSKDMGPCTCNLTRHCDYRCCCDEEDCPPEKIKEWRDENICIDSHKQLFEDYYCHNKKNTFSYNKNNATLSIKDHIYNIMCIQFDNSGEMEEFYEEKSDDDPIKDWIDSFFKPSTVNNGRRAANNIYKYGQKINNDEIFEEQIFSKDCTGKLNIYYGKPFESSCDTPICFDINTLSRKLDSQKKYEIYGDGKDKNNKITEVTYILEYNNDTISNSKTVKILYEKKSGDLTTLKTTLKIKWKNLNNEKRGSPIGYQQGTPLKISISGFYYENGFVIGMTDENGDCIINENDIVSPYSIRFKNNIMYSCRTNDYSNTIIYKTFCNSQDLKVAIAPNSTLSEKNGWIELNKDKNCENNDMDIHLIFFYYKDIIKDAKLIINNKDTTKKEKDKEGIISLSIKFLDINSFSINNKNNKITSLSLNTE